MAIPRLVVSPEAAQLGLVTTFHVDENLLNRAGDNQFDQFKESLCARYCELYTPDFVNNDPVIEGFRDLRRTVGRSPRKYPCSIESLIGFLQRHGTLPSINLAVDIYNVVSLETRLTLGAHDLDRVDGDITLCLARGDEPFTPLGSHHREAVLAGEFCYVDNGGEMLCRLDYKQCDKSKIRLETTRCLFIIQGNRQTPVEVLDGARERLVELLNRFAN